MNFLQGHLNSKAAGSREDRIRGAIGRGSALTHHHRHEVGVHVGAECERVAQVDPVITYKDGGSGARP
jgi:hypothetical protein